MCRRLTGSSLAPSPVPMTTAYPFAVLIGMCLLPITFYLVPSIGDLKILGIPVPWLVLGLAPFPILYGVGWVFRRQAERHERDFVNMVDR